MKMLKRVLAWPMFWLTYGFGHLMFLVCDSKIWPEDVLDGSWYDKVFSAFYEGYQVGMRYSLFWNDWADLGQWTDTPDSEHQKLVE